MTHRILIIEDDYAIIRGLKDSFSQKGFNVKCAMDGEQALSEIQSAYFDLILLDIMLPKHNGFEICQHIREASIDTPLVMLTALGDEENIVRGLNLGADDYITKPFSIVQLHAKCEALLRRYKATETTQYTFGNFTFDIHARTLHHAQTGAIKLTPKEFSLLHLFLRRESRALTRQTILQAAWSGSLLTTERSVDRCVTTLRKKIENNPKHPKHIHVVRDVGYKFTL